MTEIYWAWVATIEPASFWLGVGFASFIWALVSGRRKVPPLAYQWNRPEVPPLAYQWNRPEVLPPVGCPLVLLLGHGAVRAERVSYLRDRAGDMDYRLSDGSTIRGRYQWSYP